MIFTVPPLFVVEFLHHILNLFDDYFHESNESAIKDNYVIVYEVRWIQCSICILVFCIALLMYILYNYFIHDRVRSVIGRNAGQWFSSSHRIQRAERTCSTSQPPAQHHRHCHWEVFKVSTKMIRFAVVCRISTFKLNESGCRDGQLT